MSLVTEWYNSFVIPRLTIGDPENAPDGYAFAVQASVGTDGYVIDLAADTLYELTTLSQAIWYAVLVDKEFTLDINGVPTAGDDAVKLALLQVADGTPRGHYLAASGKTIIGTGSTKCATFVVKSAASTATVILAPLGNKLSPDSR